MSDVEYGWPEYTADLIALQYRLSAAARSALASDPWVVDDRATIGGCFVTFARGKSGPGHTGDRAWAAAAVWRAGAIQARFVAVQRVPAAYAPGLLAAREGPVLEAAVTGLGIRPDVLLVNATGFDHPRHAGLAIHLGAVMDLPTVGVTHRPLVACGPIPDDQSRGSRAPVFVGDGCAGYWVRTRSGARPVIAHSGWRTDPETAVHTVLAATAPRARTPAPLREARRCARTARATDTEHTAPDQ